jgi:hypothetical protein
MKAITMSEHPQILATAVAYYLEQEEARLQSLHEALARLHACLVNGELAQISAALEEFLVQAKRAEKLQAEREALKRNLPVRGDGSVDWLAFESRLTADTAVSLRRQRERLRQLALEMQRNLRRVAVLAWFGRELYGRMLAAILNESAPGSGNYDRHGQPSQRCCDPLIQLLG